MEIFQWVQYIFSADKSFYYHYLLLTVIWQFWV